MRRLPLRHTVAYITSPVYLYRLLVFTVACVLKNADDQHTTQLRGAVMQCELMLIDIIIYDTSWHVMTFAYARINRL